MAGALWPAARLSRSLRQVSDMDALGINRVMLLPTWFVRLTLLRDPGGCHPCLRLQRLDYCSTDRHRLFPFGIVPLQTVEGSIMELRRVAKRPAGGRGSAAKLPIFPQPSRIQCAPPMTAWGHEERFPPSRLSARCRFSQRIFAGTRGNGREAPSPAIRRRQALGGTPTSKRSESPV